MNEQITKEIKEFSKLVQILVTSKDITKKHIADNANISVNTLNNLLEGKNVGLKTFLSVLYSLEMSLPDAIAEVHRTGFKLTSFKTDKSQMIDVIKVRDEIKKGSNPNQVAMRLGIESNKAEEVASALA
jgi:transcriptional regulator with XRE-family HTH domain